MKHRTRQQRRPSASPSKLGPELVFHIDRLTHDARGIAKANGKVTFIAGALPGEDVSARVFKSNRRYDEARLVKVQQASETRVVPECLHFEQCGGCCFMHLAYPEQITAKQTWLEGQLRKLEFTGEVSQLIDEPLAYRRRARLAVKTLKDGAVSMGFRGKSSADIVDLDNCIVMTKKLQAIMPNLRQVLDQSERPNVIGHIELLEDDLGCSVLLRLTAPLLENDHELWSKSAASNGWDLYLQEPTQDKVKCEEESLRQYSLNELSIHYHPQDFIQVNSRMNNKMLAQALQWLALTEQDKVLDLFCGAGNFSLPMAKVAAKVVGVEVQPQMVLNGERNARFNGLDNVTFIGADLTQPVRHNELKKGFTKAFLDPPRAGAFEFLPSLLKLKIETILYVSCDAATLARDAEFLVTHGYQVKRVSMMEMFPQTAHVETMMLLQKKH